MNWETISTAAVTAAVTTLVALGLTRGIPQAWRRVRTPRLEWLLTRDTAGNWTARREGKRPALDVSYSLGLQGVNVTPQSTGGRLDPAVVDMSRGGYSNLPQVEWDHVGFSWIDRGRRVSVWAEVTDPSIRRVELRGASSKVTM